MGQTLATPGVLEALSQAEQTPDEFLARHQSGDWGDLVEEDIAENELSLEERFRPLSAYQLNTGVRIWTITERDRSATTILLLEEYQPGRANLTIIEGRSLITIEPTIWDTLEANAVVLVGAVLIEERALDEGAK